jgi:hypothetical protein
MPFDEICNVGYGKCEFVEQDLDPRKVLVTVCQNLLPLFVYLVSNLSYDSMQWDEVYARTNAVATHVALFSKQPLRL